MSGCADSRLHICSGRCSAERFSSSKTNSKDRQLFSSTERCSATSGSLPPSRSIFSAIHLERLFLPTHIWRRLYMEETFFELRVMHFLSLMFEQSCLLSHLYVPPA